MPTMAIEAIVTVLMNILSWILKKKINDEELLKAFKQFSELARSENIKTILARQNAEKQIEAGNKKWDAIEEAEREASKKGLRNPKG